MPKTNYRKSRSPSSEDESPYVSGEFAEHEYPEIDIGRGVAANAAAEQSNPRFKALMDKLRAAARKVGHMMFLF
jgi:hypothetical protein